MIIDLAAHRILDFLDGLVDSVLVGRADYEEINIRIRLETSFHKGPEKKSEINAFHLTQFIPELGLDTERFLDDGLDLPQKRIAFIEPVDIQVASLLEADEILDQQFVQFSLSCACRSFHLAGNFAEIEFFPLIIDEQKDDFFSYSGSTKDIKH